MKNTKKSFILLSTTFIIFFIILSIGYFVKYSTSITSKEFHKDLVKIRGYWAVYGSKELNTTMEYKYYRLNNATFLYELNTSRTDTGSGIEYSWDIKDDSSSGIKNIDIFKRVLKVNATNYNQTIYYKFQGN